ncbi:AI-2E family transporter [Sporanaerobium hydrogeniformans]|uniref:AI-2E family transporter n=1 Tax=Sporanaerobium hydrogeniformans TaxID=3072179 RepID=A0AC61DGK2_9FIRM|nr:AI-2E family transporter [Sporanaerobium hydrogeniformans]PHV72301.1 AI-2E family transporter [Sporanaerobium hydrogeniformans]
MNHSSPKFKQQLLLVTYIVLLAYVLLNLRDVLNFASYLLGIISPLLVGIAIAFVLNIPMTFVENKALCFLDKTKKGFRLKRSLAITITLILVFALFIGFIFFVVPQLVQSVSSLANTIPSYLKAFEGFINHYVSSSDLLAQMTNELLVAWKDLLKIGTQILGSSLSGLLNVTLGITSSIVDFALAIVLAVYMLSSKEKLLFHIKKFIIAFLDTKWANRFLEVGQLANITFHHFIAGQFTEALIISVLCFIGMTLLSMPYALLISVIIGVTSLIPIFGAFIGTLPGAFIIFIIDPWEALWFIVFIIVLQQFEGNIIYPRIVGTSIGLSAIWVMVAMLVGGSLFGILGMLLGIPLCSIFYQLLSRSVNARLIRKHFNA